MDILVPAWVKIIAAGLVCILCFACGWVVNDWRHDSTSLDELREATAEVNKQSTKLLAAGERLENSRATEKTASTVREHTIREIYRDRPINVDCALDAAAGRVLDEGIAAANARAAGEPAGVVRTDRGTP